MANGAEPDTCRRVTTQVMLGIAGGGAHAVLVGARAFLRSKRTGKLLARKNGETADEETEWVYEITLFNSGYGVDPPGANRPGTDAHRADPRARGRQPHKVRAEAIERRERLEELAALQKLADSEFKRAKVSELQRQTGGCGKTEDCSSGGPKWAKCSFTGEMS